jgi:hypothetical protein
VINGSRSVLVQSDGELIDVLRAGQGVLIVLPLAGVKDEIDTAIVELRSPVEAVAHPSTEGEAAGAVSP